MTAKKRERERHDQTPSLVATRRISRPPETVNRDRANFAVRLINDAYADDVQLYRSNIFTIQRVIPPDRGESKGEAGSGRA